MSNEATKKIVISRLYEAGDIQVRDAGLELPDWLDPTITCGQVGGILQGGCESGSYMPAVEYHMAMNTMQSHGEAVLDYLTHYCRIHDVSIRERSWPGLACFFVSKAVEHWCKTNAQRILANVTCPECQEFRQLDEDYGLCEPCTEAMLRGRILDAVEDGTVTKSEVIQVIFNAKNPERN